MVGDVLSQHHEGHRREEHEHVEYVTNAADLAGAFLEHAQEGEFRNLKDLHAVKGGQVDDLQGLAAGGFADEGQRQRDGVGAQDADDEGNQLHALGALHGSEHRDEEGQQADEDVHQAVVIGGNGGVGQVVHGAAAQGQTDQRHGGADDHGGQQLVDPAGAGGLDDQGDEDVHQAGEDRAQEDAHVTESGGADQGRDEGKGAAQEYGAFELGHQQIEQRAEARAAQRGRLAHVLGAAAGIHQHGHQQRGRHNGQHLLESVHQILADRGLVVNVIHQFHQESLRTQDLPGYVKSGHKKSLPYRAASNMRKFPLRLSPPCLSTASCRSLCTVLKT